MVARRYGDAEIAQLLERAADLQARSGGGGSGGLTLEELRQVAAEAGIDPDLLSTAAAELEAADRRAREADGEAGPAAGGAATRAGTPARRDGAAAPTGPDGRPSRSTGFLGVESEEPKRILGDPTTWVETADLPVSLAASDTERLVARVEASLAQRGNLVQTGKVAQWFTSSRGYGSAILQMEPLPDGSRLRLTVDRHEQGQTTHATGVGLGMAAGVLAGMTTGDAVVAGALTGMGALLGHVGSRAAWHYTARRWRRRVNDLMSALCGDAMRHGRPLAPLPGPDPDAGGTAGTGHAAAAGKPGAASRESP